MKHRVRAVIEKDGKLLLIKRVKSAGTHWVFPGGGVEDGESHEQALIRECKEELGVDVSVGKLVFENIFEMEKIGQQKEFFYACKIVGGKLGSGEGPEFQSDSTYEGTHELEWIEISRLSEFNIKPDDIKKLFK
ncbi:MAG: MutT/NUDIX family protein [uncultured bacterium]|nr:MAG: MutT/NUDIX family protein [uncultured bacterium]